MVPQPFELEIAPSAPRRVAGVAALAVLGAVLVAVALARPPEAIGWRLFLPALGAASLWSARRLWLASSRGLVLTDRGLREAGPGGRWLAALDAVEGVERGALAFKPSSGFLLRTREPGPSAWAPGVWWRVGRRVGVGGVLRAADARAAAETLAAISAASSAPSRSAGRSGGG